MDVKSSEGQHLNRSRTAASLAPMYLLSTSGPFTLTKRMPAAATAAATMWVLPHPGGPYSSTPVRNLKGALYMRQRCYGLAALVADAANMEGFDIHNTWEA